MSGVYSFNLYLCATPDVLEQISVSLGRFSPHNSNKLFTCPLTSQSDSGESRWAVMSDNACRTPDRCCCLLRIWTMRNVSPCAFLLLVEQVSFRGVKASLNMSCQCPSVLHLSWKRGAGENLEWEKASHYLTQLSVQCWAPLHPDFTRYSWRARVRCHKTLSGYENRIIAT